MELIKGITLLLFKNIFFLVIVWMLSHHILQSSWVDFVESSRHKKKLANISMKIITWHYGNHVKMHFKRFPMINILLLYKLLQVKDLKLYATWTQTFYQLKCESEVFSFHCYWMEAVFSEFFFLSDTCAQVSGMLVILLW